MNRAAPAPTSMPRSATLLVLGLAVASCTQATPAGRPGTAAAAAATPVVAAPPACVDFDAFANGPWRAEHPMPNGTKKWSRRVAAREQNRAALEQLLTELWRRRDWPRGSPEQILGDTYASCMDQAGIDAAGLAPLAPWLAEIDGMRSAADVQRVLRRLHDVGVFALFGTNGAFDYREPSRFEVNVVADAPAGMTRDALLGTDAASTAARDRHQHAIADVLGRSGLPAAAAADAAHRILEMERRLAEASLPAAQAADPAATWHRMPFQELERLAPHVDWKTYFAEAGWARDDVNVPDPGWLRAVDRELGATPVADWRGVLRWRLLSSASPALSPRFALAAADAGRAEKPRARACVDATEEIFGELVGRKYVERHFVPAAKAKMQDLVRALLASLEEEVDALDWMTPETRRKAHEKLATFVVQVGYPDTWQDYSGVEVDRGQYFANVLAGRRFNVRASRRLVGKPTDRGSWLLPPSSPDAYIEPQLHELVVPAGFLQPPAFDLGSSDATNYGAIGAGIAHDMIHGIDPLGADYEPSGAPRNWWTDADRDGLERRGQCVREQFDAYLAEPGLHLNGRLVFSEAAADLGGARVAFRALERSRAAHPAPSAYGLTPEQQFFVSLARLRGDELRPDAAREQVASDIHPLGRYRVIGTLSNMPEFQRAFSCPEGAPMVRPAELRCSVW